MEDDHYTDDDHIEQLLFHRENGYDEIVNMDEEMRYERLKVILEDTEKAEKQEHHSKNMLTNTKNRENVNSCVIQFSKKKNILRSTHKYGNTKSKR